MVLDIALGVVLGVLLLALLPVVLLGSIVLLRWLVPIALAVVAVWLLLQYPAQTAGSIGLLAIALVAAAAWLVLPTKLAQTNSRFARTLASVHAVYIALLDNKPPYTAKRWLPLRLLALVVAIVVAGSLAMGALLGLSAIWAR